MNPWGYNSHLHSPMSKKEWAIFWSFITACIVAISSCSIYFNPKDYDSIPPCLVGVWREINLTVENKRYVTISELSIMGDIVKRVTGPKRSIFSEYELYTGGNFQYWCRLYSDGVLSIEHGQAGEDRYGNELRDSFSYGSFAKE